MTDPQLSIRFKCSNPRCMRFCAKGRSKCFRCLWLNARWMKLKRTKPTT